MRAFGALDARLFADTAHPLVCAGRCIAGLAGLPALESTRVDVFAAAEQRSKERNPFRCRRMLAQRAVGGILGFLIGKKSKEDPKQSMIENVLVGVFGAAWRNFAALVD